MSIDALMINLRSRRTGPPNTRKDVSELLHGTSSIRNLRSNSHHNLEVKRTNSKAGGNAFEICGPRLWNRLPDYIKTATNTDNFKKLLKTAYFKAAYNI